MAILLTKAGRVSLARSFYRDIVSGYNLYSFALGKTTAWDDEENPDAPFEVETQLRAFKRDILLSRAVTSADVCHLVRRIDWTSGQFYDPYDDAYSAASPSPSGATTLADARFYVITDDLNVYKCIDNTNESSTEPSTVKPTATSTGYISEGDGYVWKFMFQVSSSDETRFLDAEHIPVRKLTTTPYGDVNGELDSILVTNGGSGYTSIPTVVINGDGKDAVATATVVGGVVTDDIAVTNPGSGYTFAFITFAGGGDGSGATASVSLGDTDPNPSLQTAVEVAAGNTAGSISRIVLTSGGSGYVSGDVTVSIEGDGTGAVVSPIVTAGTGVITRFEITSVGSGYTYANLVLSSSGNFGSGASARVVLSPIDGHGGNPVNELYSTTVGIVTSLDDNTNTDLFLGNDFRQVGLFKNFRSYADPTQIWSANTGTPLFIINVDSDSNYAVDDVITTDTGGKFIVVQITDGINGDAGTFNVHLQSIIPLLENSSVLTNTTQAIASLSINRRELPEILSSSGELIYIDNRAAISRSVDQVETIKALVNF